MTFKYLKKSVLLRLICVAFLPALTIALSSSFSTTAKFFTHFVEMDRSNFASIYRLISEVSFRRLPLYVFIMLIFACISAVMVGIINNHIRTGTFRIGIFKYLNENFLPCIKTIFLIMSLMTLFGIFLSLFILLWSFGLENVPAFVFSLISLVVLFFLLLATFVKILLWCPDMVITGKKATSALAFSLRYTRKRFWGILFSIAMPLLPIFLIIYTCSFFDVHFLITLAVNFVLSLFALVYYPSLIFVAYYDITGMERQDLYQNPIKW